MADGKKEPGICEVPGCGRRVGIKSSGMCMMHYQRDYRAKDGTVSDKDGASVRFCFLGGCGRKVFKAGLCRVHYQRLNNDDPDWSRPIDSKIAKWWAEHPEERERRSRQIWSREALPPEVLLRKAERYCVSRMLDPVENRGTAILWFRALVCYGLPGVTPRTEVVNEVERSGFVVGLADAFGWSSPVFFAPSDGETTRDAREARVFGTRAEAVGFAGAMDPGEGRRTRVYQRARAVAGDFGFYS